MIKLLDDPSVRDWLKKAEAAKGEPKPNVVETDVDEWEHQARAKFRGVLHAVPSLPSEYLAAARRIRAEAVASGFMPAAFVIGGVLVLSLLMEWAARTLIARTLYGNRMMSSTVKEVVPLFIFTLVVAVAFLSIDWPPLMRSAILYYLLAAIAFRWIAALAAMARSADSVSPFMYRRVLWFACIASFGIATGALARRLSVPPDVNYAASILGSIALLAICIEAVWRRPEPAARTLWTNLLHTAYFVVLWLIWSFGFRILFWLAVYAVLLPKIMPFVDRFARAFIESRWPDEPENSLRTVFVVRGVRAVVYALAVAWLVFVWEYNPSGLVRTHSALDSIVLGLLQGLIVLLVADLGWNIAKAMIDRKLQTVRGDAPVSPEEAARRARLGTLLPIFKNALAALLIVITVLTVLSGMGVQIAPLIAGAGIFGVAIGFGSQTLVKDVISGVFYLMDDAFRVGEYIQSGSYKGTVESFSLRSVRLRHHRGPVFTVPFGELGAVQNMSRDWAIDKFLLRVPFEADLTKAKKLVKTVGAALSEDPELAPYIIEPLKMKGVEQIGDYGIDLAFSFKAVPGYQSMIRRRAYTQIRQIFKENGIEFAQPTVNVGGEEKGDATAAAQSLAIKKQAEAAAQPPPEG